MKRRGKSAIGSEENQELLTPKVRVRHARVVEKTEEELKPEPLIFNGSNLFDVPKVETEEEEKPSTVFSFFAEPDDEPEEEPVQETTEVLKERLVPEQESREEPEKEQLVPPPVEEQIASEEQKSEPEVFVFETGTQEPEPEEEGPKPEELVSRVPEKGAVSTTRRVSFSVLEKVRRSVGNFTKMNNGVTSDDVEIRYAEDELEPVDVLKDGTLLLPNRRVYLGPMVQPWDSMSEVRIPRGQEVELDVGVSFLLPENYALEVYGADSMCDKHGLVLSDGKVLMSRQEAYFPIVLKVKAISDVSYISKLGKVVQCRLVPLE